MSQPSRRRAPLLLAALCLFALPAASAGARPAATASAGKWTTLVHHRLTAKALDLPASASPRRLARAALSRSAGRLGLRGSLRGLRLVSADRAPRVAGARDLRTLRFRQTAGGLRVLYSQIDVAVVGASVTSISATSIPLATTRLRGAERVSAERARTIARRRIAGPDTALPAQAIADAGTPRKPHAPRRAWVVQVTPATAVTHDGEELNWCVVIDARSGKVLDVWKGVAAAPERPKAAARTAQAGETVMTTVRDANLQLGTTGILAATINTVGDPFLYGDDGDLFTRIFPEGGSAAPEAFSAAVRMHSVPYHMCRSRQYCGRDGGFDGTFNGFRVTARAPAQTDPPQNDRGTRYSISQRRVYIQSSDARSYDLLAHELGHQIDLTKGGDRTAGIDVLEAEEALADMYAYDYDHDDPTIGEEVGFPRINLKTPNALKDLTENALFPARNRDFKCTRTNVHFNGTIDSHAYFLFDQAVGRDKAGAVLHQVSSSLGPTFDGFDLRDRFMQRAGEMFGNSARTAAYNAWTAVGRQPGNIEPPQGAGC